MDEGARTLWQALFDLSDPHLQATIAGHFWGVALIFLTLAVLRVPWTQRIVNPWWDECRDIVQQWREGRPIQFPEGLLLLGVCLFEAVFLLALAVAAGIVG